MEYLNQYLDDLIDVSTKKCIEKFLYEKINIPILENQFIFTIYSNRCDSIYHYSEQCILNLKETEEMILYFSHCRVYCEKNHEIFNIILNDFGKPNLDLNNNNDTIITLDYEKIDQEPYWSIKENVSPPNILLYDYEMRNFFQQNLDKTECILSIIYTQMKLNMLLHNIVSVYENYLTKLYEKYKFQLQLIHGDYFEKIYNSNEDSSESEQYSESEQDIIDLDFNATYIKKSVIGNL